MAATAWWYQESRFGQAFTESRVRQHGDHTLVSAVRQSDSTEVEEFTAKLGGSDHCHPQSASRWSAAGKATGHRLSEEDEAASWPVHVQTV